MSHNDPGADPSGNAFEENKPGTNARTEAEALIEDLRAKGGLFVEAVRATRMPMAVSDPSLPGNPLVFANDAFLRLSGYSVDEVLGQQPYFMNGEDTDPADALRFREALQQDHDEVIETIQYRKDGSRFVASLFLSAFKDEDGRTLFHFLSYLDVTARVAAERELLTRRRIEAQLRRRDQQLTAIFEALPDAFYVLDRDESFAFASQSALDTWGKRTDEILGRRYLDCFPDAAGGEPYEAHRRVMRTGEAERLETVSAVPDGWVEIDIARPTTGGVAVTLRDISERRHAEAQLRQSEERHRLILESARDYAIFTTDPDGIIRTWPAGAQAVFGWTPEEAIGQPIDITFTHEDVIAQQPVTEREIARRDGRAPNVRWHIRKDGSRVFIDGVTFPLCAADAVAGYLKVGRDTTEQRGLEEHQQVLVAELQHRTRNLIGVVRAISEGTIRGSADLADFRERFGNRLMALSRVQGLLSRLDEHDRVTFDDLIRTELSAIHVDPSRISLHGPKDIRLRSSTLQTLAMAIHELITNAVKYGALSQPLARLSVSWELKPVDADEPPWLHIDWQESGVDMVLQDGAPRRRGQGTTLIEMALPYQLGAKTSYVMGEDGVRCTITIPVSRAKPEVDDGRKEP